MEKVGRELFCSNCNSQHCRIVCCFCWILFFADEKGDIIASTPSVEIMDEIIEAASGAVELSGNLDAKIANFDRNKLNIFVSNTTKETIDFPMVELDIFIYANR